MSTFRHVVMFRWADGIDPAHPATALAALAALPTQIPGILRYEHGPDAGVNEGNFDFVLVADFASVDDYLVYRDHPAHQQFLATYIKGFIAERAAVQYEVG
jgi:hypothetical protein